MRDVVTRVRTTAVHDRRRAVLLISLILLYLFNDLRLIRIYSGTQHFSLINTIAFVITYFLASLCFLPLLFNRNTLLRKLSEVLLFSCIYTDLLYIFIEGYPFSSNDALNIFNNYNYAGAAISSFKNAFAGAFAATGALFVLLAYARKAVALSFPAATGLPFLFAVAILSVAVKASPTMADKLPGPFRIISNFVAASVNKTPSATRTKIEQTPGKAQVKHLFMVTDESITGSFLSLNGYREPTTPFLDSVVGSIINYGIACSFTNQSYGSNMLLINGATRAELPDEGFHLLRKPTIFQYAKKAGFTTIYIDGQLSLGTAHNYLPEEDLQYIDSLIQPGMETPAIPYYERDMRIAEAIIRLSSYPEPVFAYVNKAGAHWPYARNFPSTVRTFSNNKDKGPQRILNEYKDAIRWTVDNFWHKLIDSIDTRSNTIILYTSDHGQDFSRGAHKMHHASVFNTRTNEADVPLWVYNRSDYPWPDVAGKYRNRYSHATLFPALLRLMGYDSSFIYKAYGPSLLDPPAEGKRWFLTGDIYGRAKTEKVMFDEK